MGGEIQILGSIGLALIPAILWGTFFYKKNPEDKRLLFLTFFLGALSVFPILLYKFSWTYFPWLNAFEFANRFDHIIGFAGIILPISVIITFMIVGVIEEVMKLLSVKLVDDDKFDSIDDSMEYFIVAALGFSFTENILYFYTIWNTMGTENLMIPFLFRSSFSTFAHIMFSGILGYYYGIAHFAKPILQDKIKSKRWHWTILLHKIFSFRRERLFYQEKLLEGFLIAIILHAVFNIFLEINLLYMLIPFLIGGYITLNILFAKKNSHKNYRLLLNGKRNHPSTKSGIYFEMRPIKVKSD